MATLQMIVDDFLAQKRIAVVGVRTTTQDAANAIYDKFKGAGYEVFAVNPKVESFNGEPCYPNVGEIPGGVDLAMICTNPTVTEQVVKDCHAAGVKRVWMHRSIGDSSSPVAVEYCKEHGMAVLPGGCPMMFVDPVDFGHQCMRFIGKLSGWMPKEMEVPTA